MKYKKIKDYYQKPYSIPIYSGTLAIESLLKIFNLEPTDRVLISSISCYSILEAVLNANLTPVIATPQNGLLFTKDELQEILKKENIKVYIAVHQYGYYQEFPIVKDIIVIEDYSQAWDLTMKDTDYANYIIISLGATKPLSNGIGGLILSNKDITTAFDLKTKNQRYQETSLLETYYPLPINEKKLIKIATRKVKKQRKFAKKLDKVLQEFSDIHVVIPNNVLPSYHRYVIEVEDKLKEQMQRILDSADLKYQLEFKKKLCDLPIVKKNKIQTIGKSNKRTMFLIKTNQPLKKIKKFQRKMRNYYEKTNYSLH